MQRWIAVGVVAMMLLVGGGGFARHVYKQNRAQAMWVPLPINPELPLAKRDALMQKLKTKLSDQALLVKVSRDLGLTHKWQVASDEEGARKIRERLFVKAGEADTPLGKVPSINIGVTGKYKERAISGEIAMRLMADVWQIAGLPAHAAPRKPDA